LVLSWFVLSVLYCTVLCCLTARLIPARGHHPLAGPRLISSVSLRGNAATFQTGFMPGGSRSQLDCRLFDSCLTACCALLAFLLDSPHRRLGSDLAFAIEWICASLTGNSCAGVSAVFHPPPARPAAIRFWVLCGPTPLLVTVARSRAGIRNEF